MMFRHKTIIVLIALTVVMSAIPVSAQDIPEVVGEFKEYTAQSGQDLYTVARKFDLAIEHLMFANGMKGIKTTPGQKLLIPTRRIPPSVSMTDGIVLNLPERGLYLYKNGQVEKFYPVAIGATGKWMTPTGDYKIITKVTDPTWLPPEWAKEEDPVPAGPDNPLGDRWMGLNAPGYGIHATNRPVSIGLAASHGCIRMYPESAHDLFERVSVGTPVKIVYEPVKLGYDSKNKQYLIEVYPDIYGKTQGIMKYAHDKLVQHGLLPMVDESKLKQIVGTPKGIPEPIISSPVVVKVNNKKQNLAFPPIMKDGRIWTSSEALKPIGAVLIWNNEEKEVKIYRGKKKVTLPVVNGEEDSKGRIVSFLWNGRTVIPLSYVLKQLDVNFYWLPEYRTLLVYSGSKKPKAANKVKQNGRKPVAKPKVKPVKHTPTPVVKPTVATPSPSPVISPAPEPTLSPSPSPTPESPVPSEIPDDLPPIEETPEPDDDPN